MMPIMAKQDRCLMHGGTMEVSEDQCEMCRDLGAMAANRPPITEQEKAVIEAAKAWHGSFGNDARNWAIGTASRKLANAVNALSQPKAVSPDQLKPGDRFRFRPEDAGKKGTVNRIVWVYRDDSIGDDYHVQWMGGGDSRVYVFAKDSLVVPIPEEE